MPAAPAKPPERRLQVSPDACVRSLVGSGLDVADLLRPHGTLWSLRSALRRSVASGMLSPADVNAASRAMAARARYEYGSPPGPASHVVGADPDWDWLKYT